MKQSIRRGTYAFAAAGLALVLASCGGGVTGGSETTTDASPDSTGSTEASTDAPAELSGNLAGAGASSQAKAQEGWIAGFTEDHSGVQLSYDPVGSSGGRQQFLSGGVLFAGTDSVFKEEEIAQAKDRCFGGDLVELPLYISPIAVVYNLPDLGTEHLQLSPETLARIFRGDIKTWDDAAIAAENPDATLPATAITVVNRSDDSGTTKNFTDYLHATAPEVWTDQAEEAWPIPSVQSGDGTSGMVTTVASAPGAIGYADASQAGDLGTVAVKVGEEYVPFSAEAAAKALDSSPLHEDATETQITFKLDRTTKEAGAYPIVLISYLAGCTTYDSASDAANVASYFDYIASEAGQERSAQAAGTAPISADLRTKIEAAVAKISAS